MAAHQRRRLASALAHCLFATGVFTGALGCAVDPPAPPDPLDPINPIVPGTTQERIDHSLGRLADLDVLEVEALATSRTEHQWVPYGGTWNSSKVEMEPLEQADRLQSLADMAEQAVAGIDGSDIGGFASEAICYQLDPGKYCLTIDTLAANLNHVNQLEIVDVTDIIRSAPSETGFCYSSWETVGEDDCVRGIKLDAIAQATRDFPSSIPPTEAPE